MTAARSRPRSATAGVGSTPARTAFPFAERAQRLLRLGELVRPVDGRLQLTALEQVGERLEILLVEFRDEELDLVRAAERRELDGRDVPQNAPAAVCADDHEPAFRLERAPQREPRVAPGDVEDQVVARIRSREVLVQTIDDPAGAERARELDIASAHDGR